MKHKFLKPGEGSGKPEGMMVYRGLYPNYTDALIAVDMEDGSEFSITSNLQIPGMGCMKDEIIIGHDLYDNELYKDFINDFCDFLVEERITEFTYGPFNAKGLKVRLKPNWKDLTTLLY